MVNLLRKHRTTKKQLFLVVLCLRHAQQEGLAHFGVSAVIPPSKMPPHPVTQGPPDPVGGKCGTSALVIPGNRGWNHANTQERCFINDIKSCQVTLTTHRGEEGGEHNESG